MRALLLALLISPAVCMAGTVDPAGKELAGVGIERLTLSGCGTFGYVSQLTPAPQTADTFQVNRRTVLARYGMVDSTYTGGYGLVGGRMYLTPSDATRAAILAFVVDQAALYCPGATGFDARTYAVTGAEIRIREDGGAVGKLEARGDFAGGSFAYTIKIRGYFQ